MPTKEQPALGSLLWHRHQLAFIILLLFIVDHVEPLHRLSSSHVHFRMDHHGAREGLPDYRSLWRQPTSTTKELQIEGRANIDGATDAAPKISGTNLRQLLISRKLMDQSAGWSTWSRQEVEALNTFKSGLSGGDLAILRSWRANDTTACAWAGVVCSPNKQDPQVIALTLRGHNLVGNITSALIALGQLGFLQRLDLSHNVFTGTISGAALSNFSRLSYLNVSYNQLSGAIPFQIDALVNLETLDLGTNNLTGQIPLSMGNCTSLRRIALASNLLQGRIPQELGRLVRLQYLDLGSYLPGFVVGFDNPPSRNSFSGSIPSALSNCSLLTHLDLQYNTGLGGELPPELSKLQHLQYVSLGRCSFTGTLPTWIGNFTSLTMFIMSGNRLHGHIPDEFGQLRNLTGLVLGKNNFTGAIPATLFNCTSFIEIALEYNMLSGIIPSQVGFLRSLEYLSLAANEFTGVIPAALANCSFLRFLQLGSYVQSVPLMDPEVIPSWISSLSHLQDLYLFNMNLYGNIPIDIGRLYQLALLDLEQNYLTGPIPISLKNCTSLSYLDLDDNNLTGPIPSELGLLENLVDLSLYQNSLTGPFPPFITNLTQLQSIQVGINFFHGEIGGQWGMLSQLLVCSLAGNQFVGPIPSTLSNSSNLFEIDLSSNKLTGEIPPSFGNLSHLEQLSLSDNQFAGVVPIDLARCPLLGGLYLSATNLEGTISSINIDKLSSLVILDLSHNKLSGVILDSFQNFTQLMDLDLSYNRFSGNAPGQSLSKIPALTSLNLSHNLFSGPWPRQWSDLERIQEIDISANMFSGPIPNSTFRNFKSLVHLDLSRNKFSGPLPQSLASLSSLALFNASYNSFEGPIPTSGAFKSNITGTSFLGNPGLCGTILGLSRECLIHEPNPNGTCKFFSCKKIWISVCIGVPLAIALVLLVTGWAWRKRLVAKDHQRNDAFDLFLSFGYHLRFEATDILQIIQRVDDNVIGAGVKSVRV